MYHVLNAMNTRRTTLIVVAAFASITPQFLAGAPGSPGPTARFEPNVGPAGAGTLFVVRGAGPPAALNGREAAIGLGSRALRMQLVGAAKPSVSRPEGRLASVTNYYIGNDPKQWRSGVPNYERVRFEEVYPGVDLIYYGHQEGLEYDFVLKPGADPDLIRIAWSGADSMRLDPHGDLVLTAEGVELRQKKPIVYQQTDEGRVEIESRYQFRHGEVRLALGAYDHPTELVVDPALVYSTYLGGPNLDQAVGLAVDKTGSVYITGTTNGGFPTLNAEQPVYGRGGNAFVTKLRPTGALAYSTYLGGFSDVGNAIAVDKSSGAASSQGARALSSPTLNAAQSTFGGGGSDILVVKLDSTGALAYSTYLGGPTQDSGIGIAVDGSGAAYVTGASQGQFPVLNAAQSKFGGTQDVVVAKLSPSGGVVYSTYWAAPMTIRGMRSQSTARERPISPEIHKENM